MPLSVKKLSDIRRTVAIPFDGDTLHVTYRLSALNSGLADWLEQHGEERRSMQRWIERVVVDWDILEDDGQHLPVALEAMDRYEIPTSLFTLIFQYVAEDASPKSLRTSYTATEPSASATARNGSRSSSPVAS